MTEPLREGETSRCSSTACQRVYRVPSHLGIGAADLEGLVLIRDGKEIRPEDAHLCPDCVIKALAGKRPFRRRDNIVQW